MNVATITIIWMALQLIGGFIRIGDSGGVAFWSHVGGFLGGILISLVFRAPDLGQVRLGHEVLDRMNNRGPVAAATAAKQHLEKHPGDPKALRQLARAYSQMGEPAEEAKAIMGLLEVEPLAEHPNLLARLLEIGQAKLISSHKRTALAEKFKDMNPAVARALLTSVLQEPPTDSQRPEALLALVGLERERSPKSAQALLDELLRTYPLPSLYRSSQEARMGQLKQRWRAIRPEILSGIIYFFVNVTGRTLRIRTVNFPQDDSQTIFCGWHGRSLVFAYYFRRRDYWVIINTSAMATCRTPSSRCSASRPSGAALAAAALAPPSKASASSATAAPWPSPPMAPVALAASSRVAR